MGVFMKKIILLSLSVLSLNSFAFSTVTLKQDVTLTRSSISDSLFGTASAYTGNDYCSVTLESNLNEDKIVVKSGTVFEVSSVDQNDCGNDWGRVCRLDLTTRNSENDLDMHVICKNKGLFANKLTIEKVNKTSKGLIVVK
jgi:hypothetical protein